MEFLRNSLCGTRRDYERVYGAFEADSPDLTFVHGSNRPFAPTGLIATRIRTFLTRAENERRDVVLAINGWDGLTTNELSFASLFRPVEKIAVKLRIYVDSPRVFKEADAAIAAKVFTGEIDIETNGHLLPDSTAQFISKVRAIGAAKLLLSSDMQSLLSESHQRNTPPNPGSLQRYKCAQCGKEMPTIQTLNVHLNRSHGNKVSCKYCGMIFGRKDHRDRHEQAAICPEHPDYVAPEKKRRAPRGISERFQKRVETAASRGNPSSDNAYPAYHELQANDSRFPRVDIDKPIVYRGEVFCRFPACVHPTKFSETTKLRTHYKLKHGLMYPAYTVGRMFPIDEKTHADGLEWLARCVYMGEDTAGPQPVPERR
ncbi:hypothetical protein C8Q69DRAFT_497937 [Paecilomyces variotii]|uniref:C2H2-type domain-containing protein n=1 Tax=Byssochlamys spectabilis TaxID=264951 RepID=A0A443HWM8_BYSSP|nr:hypothetical protein C8Q69DRAFT_497937 [Paecilomyces variotii]KAJ9267849.1 hypothetical protein DTO195F2_183 [Paecilomyces variotii]KAJ9363897.1 hypothetical protein DTO280E4_2119 [Paecilomyces variotii]RWQ96239.1 hypothetical protein C8Q69DRAFT_497937 [Paecilomyces variotii]